MGNSQWKRPSRGWFKRICSISTMKVGYQMLYILCIQDIVGGQVHEFQVHRPFETPRSYQLKIGDEAIEAPMVCG